MNGRESRGIAGVDALGMSPAAFAERASGAARGAQVKDDTGLPAFACVGTYPNATTMPMNGTIGTSPNQSNYSGLIAEIILYKRVLTDPQRGTLQAYLKAKWATP